MNEKWIRISLIVGVVCFVALVGAAMVSILSIPSEFRTGIHPYLADHQKRLFLQKQDIERLQGLDKRVQLLIDIAENEAKK